MASWKAHLPSTETRPLEGKWAALLTGEVVFKSGEHLLLNVYLWVGLVGLRGFQTWPLHLSDCAFGTWRVGANLKSPSAQAQQRAAPRITVHLPVKATQHLQEFFKKTKDAYAVHGLV